MDYLPHTDADRQDMLERLGLSTLDELFDEIPEAVRQREPLDLPAGLSEPEVLAVLQDLASENVSLDEFPSFLGGGAYDHAMPSAVHHLIGRGEFYTAYTPYQAEVSQGTLQATYEFQTMICRLTGMEVANASVYDGATAVAEAALMSLAVHRQPRNRIVYAGNMHPEYIQVLETYATGLDAELTPVRVEGGLLKADAVAEALGDGDDVSALLVQHPNFFGLIEDLKPLGELAHEAGALFIVSTDPISLGILEPPGSFGADVVVGEGHAMGNPPNFGGPYFGFFAARQKYVRQLPGRIVGMTKDREGRRGYVLTLQTREQHIRRARATSNICTNQNLNALAAAVYLTALGPEGLKEVASACLRRAEYLRQGLTQIDGVSLVHPGGRPFKEFAVQVPVPAARLNARLIDDGFIGGLDLGRFDPAWRNRWLLAVTERRTKDEMDEFVAAVAQQLAGEANGHDG